MKMPICSNNACPQKAKTSCNHNMLVGFSWVVLHYVWQVSDVQHADADLQ